MNKVQLSIIVPMYNAEKYIERCINSIIPYLSPDIELIIVNDGSKDRSYELCLQLIDKYDNAKVINQENSGSVAARMNGVEISRGDYITFVDADDYIGEDYLDAAQKGMNSETDVIIYGFTRVNGELQTQIKQTLPCGIISGEKIKTDLFCKMLCSSESPYNFGIFPSVCGKFVKREIISSAFREAPKKVSLGDDAIITYNCLTKAKRIEIHDNFGYYYVDNSDSMTHRYDSRLAESSIALCKAMDQILRPLGPKVHAQLGSYIRYIALKVIDNEFNRSGKKYRDAKLSCQKFINNEIVSNSLAIKSVANCNLLGELYKYLLNNHLFLGLCLFSKIHPYL